MPSQSIQELEARLEVTLRSFEEPEADAGNPEISGHEDDLSRLQLARFGLVQALRDYIAFKTGEADRHITARRVKERHEAEMELAAAERGMGALEGGSSTQRWDRVRVARERWWNALPAQ